MIHWSIPDPAREGETDAQTYPAFQRTATELATRIPFLLELIEHTQATQERKPDVSPGAPLGGHAAQ